MAALHQGQMKTAIAWAFASACEQVFDDLAPSSRYSATTAGSGRYDQFSDRLDRVFSCKTYAVPEGAEFAGLDVLYDGLSDHARRTMPVIAAGTVVRHDLNGSNGWAYGGFRLITHSIQPGELASIDWSKEKPTKRMVAQQDPGQTREANLLEAALTHDELADLRAQAQRPEANLPTFVLAHAMGRETNDRELFIGQSRYNEDHGYPWHWFENLLDGPALGETKRPIPNTPSPADDAPDIALRLRTGTAAKDVK
jgi:hypothetical protein